MKKRKNLIKAVLILALIAVVAICGYTFAKYYQEVDIGSATGKIAKWSFNAKSTTETITLADSNGLLAPGSFGSFQILVDATGSEVPVDYSIEVSNETNIPANMIFTGFVKDASGNIIQTITNEDHTFTDFVKNLENATIEAGSNQTRTITVNWEWLYDSDDSADLISGTSDDLNCGFDITVTGTQVKS